MTAVEHLVNMLPLIQKEGLRDTIEEALELFEQQIKDAYVYGFKECEKIHEEAFFIQDLSEQYYNETFKKD
jgi:hypothetical protein